MKDKIIKFTRGIPPTESFCPDQLAECAVSALRQYSDVILQYAPSRGFTPLRQFLADQDGVNPDRVIVGQGSLQLQDLCARAIIRPGDSVFVEEPSYDRAITVLKRAGGQLTGFALGEDGPDVDEIEAALKSGLRPVIFYIIPDFQNPSGTVLSLGKRERIVQLAREYDFWIVEDVPYRRLRYYGQESPSMFDLAPDRVFKMSSYSKLIAPGLRVGYVIAPESMVGKIAKMAEDTYINASYLNHAIVYEYEQRGWLDPHIADLKELYRPRLDTLLASLEEHMTGLAEWSKPDGGFFVGMTLKADVKATDLLKKAEAANLVLTDGRGFFANGEGDNFVRLPFCALTPDEIKEGVERLAGVVKNI